MKKVLNIDANQIGTSDMAANACGKSHANQIERLVTLWLHVPIMSDHRILRHTLWQDLVPSFLHMFHGMR